MKNDSEVVAPPSYRIEVRDDESCEMASVLLDGECVMMGNYWDFHPGCHGIHEYGDFRSVAGLVKGIENKIAKTEGEWPIIWNSVGWFDDSCEWHYGEKPAEPAPEPEPAKAECPSPVAVTLLSLDESMNLVDRHMIDMAEECAHIDFVDGIDVYKELEALEAAWGGMIEKHRALMQAIKAKSDFKAS